MSEENQGVKVYQAPEGAILPQSNYDKVPLPDQEYIDRIDKATEDEIGWIVGEIPIYDPKTVHYSYIRGGGQYLSDRGQIKVNPENFRLSYPHEKLHWLSRHREKITQTMYGKQRDINTGIYVQKSPISGSRGGLNWLSEGIVTETTERILSRSGEITQVPIRYDDTPSKQTSRYNGGLEASERRFGDSFNSGEGYSELYGSMLRLLVRRIGEGLHSGELNDVYEKLRYQFENVPELPILDSVQTDDDFYELAFSLLQVGEFSLDGANTYKLIDASLGRGGLKRLVDLSSEYDLLTSKKVTQEPEFDWQRYQEVKTELEALLSNKSEA